MGRGQLSQDEVTMLAGRGKVWCAVCGAMLSSSSVVSHLVALRLLLLQLLQLLLVMVMVTRRKRMGVAGTVEFGSAAVGPFRRGMKNDATIWIPATAAVGPDGVALAHDGRHQIQNGRRRIQDGRRPIQDGRRQIQNRRRHIQDGRFQVQNGCCQFQDGRHYVQNGCCQIQDGRRRSSQNVTDPDASSCLKQDGRYRIQDGRYRIQHGGLWLCVVALSVQESGWMVLYWF